MPKVQMDEEEICPSKKENKRQQLLKVVRNQKVIIKAECPADAHQVLVVKEEIPPEQQEWRHRLDHKDPEPPYIKEEREELWTSQDADISKFPSTPVPVKSEDDEEEAEQNREEPDKEDCGGSEPASSFHLCRQFQMQTEDSEDTEDSDEDWTPSTKPESHLNKKTKPPASSLPEQMETDADGDDCGQSEEDITLVHMKDLKDTAAQSSQSMSKRSRTFDNNSSLERHMDTDIRERLAGSSECGATFSQKTNITQEDNAQRDKMTNQDSTVNDWGGKTKTHECSECGNTFGSRSHLKMHVRIHTREKPFSCSECGKGFTRKGYLLDHIKLHTGERPFSCPVCQKHFRLKSHVRRHAAVCHSSCKSNTEFTNTHSKKIQNNDFPIIDAGSKMSKQYLCSDCGKIFEKSSALERHVRIHTGEKPFDCSLCGTRFAQKANLIHHVKTHIGEKPFVCSECSKSFTRKASLHTHMKLHTGEKPFSCVVCQKCFKRKHHVQRHMRIHTRE